MRYGDKIKRIPKLRKAIKASAGLAQGDIAWIKDVKRTVDLLMEEQRLTFEVYSQLCSKNPMLNVVMNGHMYLLYEKDRGKARNMRLAARQKPLEYVQPGIHRLRGWFIIENDGKLPSGRIGCVAYDMFQPVFNSQCHEYGGVLADCIVRVTHRVRNEGRSMDSYLEPEKETT